MRRLVIPTFLVALLCTVGCATRARPLEIALREADSRRPIAGAIVRIAGADIIDPASGDVLDPGRSAAGGLVTGGGVSFRSGFRSVEGTTDPFGLVVLPAPVDAPFEILIVRTGEPLRRVLMAGSEHPATGARASRWIELDGPIREPGDRGPVLEVQVRATPF